MGKITKEQRQELVRIRSAGVLEEVKPHYLDLSHGAIIVPCSDGDQMDDLYVHMREVCKGQLPEPRLHTLALNGGAPLMSGDWPDPRPGEVLVSMIKEARDLKQIGTAILFSHAPCGAAAKNSYSVEHMINLLILAKSRLKTDCRDFRVICFFHVDWDNGSEGGERKQRTYFISRSRWLDYLQRGK
jgi:hypothetical protein